MPTRFIIDAIGTAEVRTRMSVTAATRDQALAIARQRAVRQGPEGWTLEAVHDELQLTVLETCDATAPIAINESERDTVALTPRPERK